MASGFVMKSAVAGFRQFALDVYAVGGVSKAALLLQDRADVDVNVLLLAAYVGAARGGTLRSHDLVDVRRRTESWQRDVVAPLRAVRTSLKHFPQPAAEHLRERLKALELDAEMVEVDELAAFIDDLQTPAACGTAASRAAAAMHIVLQASAGAGTSDGDAAAISTIALAAAQYVERNE